MFLSRSKRENSGKEVVIVLEHQDGGRDVISNALFLSSLYMVVFKTSTAMHSKKMSEMNSLESRDSKQKCRDPAHTSDIRMQTNERLLSLFTNCYFLFGDLRAHV